jgi:hypothetical protein
MNTIAQLDHSQGSIRLKSVKTLLKNHRHLFKFIFANMNGDLRGEPEDLLCAAGGFSHSEIVLIMHALDIWCDGCSVSLTETFETLDEHNWRQLIEALHVLSQVYVD